MTSLPKVVVQVPVLGGREEDMSNVMVVVFCQTTLS